MKVAVVRASPRRLLERAWAYSPARWWALGAGIGLAAATLLFSVSTWREAEAQSATIGAQMAQAVARGAPVQQVAAEASDFARSLGTPLPASQIAHELQRACAEAGVALVAMQAQERAPSVEQLGRLESAVQLRGGYLGSKQVLKRAAERFPGLTLQRLRMRRGASPSELETHVTLALWSAPLAHTDEGS